MISIFVPALAALLIFAAAPAAGQLRKVKVGDRMPGFSLPLLKDAAEDPNTAAFTYDPNAGQVLAVAFLSPKQSSSVRAIGDIRVALTNLGENAEQLDFVGVVSGQQDPNLLDTDDFKQAGKLTVLVDAQYRLWGKLGVIAMPTVVLVGKDGNIRWAKAGHGYDFAAALASQLRGLLGLEADAAAETVEVRTLENTGVQASIKRHIHMATVLIAKGRSEMAVAQLQKARLLDPNSIETALDLAELLCQSGKPEAALDMVKAVEPTSRLDRAKLLTISGWAKRQSADLAEAEKLLREATDVNPKSTRAFYELGKVYHATGKSQKAVQAYYKALAIIFEEPTVPDFLNSSNVE